MLCRYCGCPARICLRVARVDVIATVASLLLLCRLLLLVFFSLVLLLLCHISPSSTRFFLLMLCRVVAAAVVAAASCLISGVLPPQMMVDRGTKPMFICPCNCCSILMKFLNGLWVVLIDDNLEFIIACDLVYQIDLYLR